MVPYCQVGLVKAQHPTAQTIPGLYRQTGNASQHLLHSDSDLRLDAQGAFTRYEKRIIKSVRFCNICILKT
jgi:hypothetical protein